MSVHPDPIDTKWLHQQIETECRAIELCEQRASEARYFRAEHIADLRRAGVSLAAIAERRGVTRQTVHQWARYDGEAPASADERTAGRPKLIPSPSTPIV